MSKHLHTIDNVIVIPHNTLKYVKVLGTLLLSLHINQAKSIICNKGIYIETIGNNWVYANSCTTKV